MERILSKDEIAELLSAVKHGDVSVEPEGDQPELKKGADAVKINLADMQGPGNWRLDNFDIILDSYAQNLGISLANRIQRASTVKRTTMESMEFGGFMNDLAEKSIVSQLRLDPVRWGGLMVFDPMLSYALIEILVGGSSEGTLTVPKREMTPIELSLVRSIVTLCCPDLEKAFMPLDQIDAGVVRTERNPRLIKLVPPDAGVLVATFEITIEKWAGKMHLLIPHQSLEPYREKLIEGAVTLPPATQSTHWKQTLHSELKDVNLRLTAQAGLLSLQVRDILELQVGDVLDLGTNPDAPMNILVEGKPKLKGLVGVRDGRKAVRVTGCISHGE